jgi:hypothetical protein
MTHKLSLIVLFGFLLVGPQLAGCAEIKAPYPIQDTGLHAARSSELVWLDNHRLRFHGDRAAELKAEDVHKAPRFIGASDYIWDTEANRLVTEPSLEGAMRLCVQGDYRTFLRKSPIDEKKLFVVTQDKGQETVTPLVNAQWFNRFSCRYYEQKPEWDRGHASLPLLDGQSSLFLKGSRQNNPIMFFPPNNEKGVPFPIGTRQVYHNLVQYASFKNAYLLYPIAYIDPETGKEDPIGPWPKGKSIPMWWLAPDGKVTTEEIPYMPFMRGGSRGFYPTREGLFITSHKIDDLGKPGDAGGYPAQKGSVTKIITGYLESTAVSPDGCQVALIYDPYDTVYGKDRLNRITVKTINLCQEAQHVH